jgi:vacuolar-type H+-ATPase subunit H
MEKRKKKLWKKERRNYGKKKEEIMEKGKRKFSSVNKYEPFIILIRIFFTHHFFSSVIN